MGFLSLIFASPVYLESLNEGDAGRFVIVRGELNGFPDINEQYYDVNREILETFFNKDLLLIKEGNSIVFAIYYPLWKEDIYYEAIILQKPITVIGQIEFYENKLILKTDFLEGRPNAPFLISTIILAHYLLSSIGRRVSKWER